MKTLLFCVCSYVMLAPFMVETPDALAGWVMVAMAAVSMASSMASANEAGKQGKAAAKRQAAAYDRQMRSQIKRKKRQHMHQRGQLIEGAYQSNVDFSGSVANFYRQQSGKMDEDINEMETERRNAAINFKRTGQAAYDASRWQMASAGVQGIGAMYGAAKSSGWGAGGGVAQKQSPYGNMAGNPNG